MNEETKEKLKQFVDQDGKIIVTDDMPDDLKAAIKFLNENDVDIFSSNTTLFDNFDEEDDNSEEDYEETDELYNDSIDEEVNDEELEDLNNFL